MLIYVINAEIKQLLIIIDMCPGRVFSPPSNWWTRGTDLWPQVCLFLFLASRSENAMHFCARFELEMRWEGPRAGIIFDYYFFIWFFIWLEFIWLFPLKRKRKVACWLASIIDSHFDCDRFLPLHFYYSRSRSEFQLQIWYFKMF